MDNLHHGTVKQKYKYIFTQFSKIVDYSLGPKQKLRYGRVDFVTYLKITKKEIVGVKVLGICVVFEWPKSLIVKDRKIDTKYTFKILAKDGSNFAREVEMHITPSYQSTGFGNFLPMCELNGDYFLENDQLTVEVEGVIEPPSTIDHTKKIIVRIPFVSKMKNKHSSILFKHDLGLQWRIHTEYYESNRPGYDVFLEAIGPKFNWSCDAHTKLSIVRNYKDYGFCRTKGLKLSNQCRILPIGQFNKDEVFDPSNGFLDNFDTLTFQFLLHIYHIQGLHPEYEDGVRGILPIVMNQLPNIDHKLNPNLTYEIKIPKFTEFKNATYSVLDHAQNLFWVAFMKVEKIKFNNQFDTEALGVYVHCFDPSGLNNWSCVGDIRFTLKALRKENYLERHAIHTFTHQENTFGFNNMLLMKEIMCSERNYLHNNSISVLFKINCHPRQEIDKTIKNINIPGTIDMRGTIKMTVKNFSKFSDVQVTPDWVDIGSTSFKIMVMTHHKLFHNTVVDKVLAFYVKCDSNRKPKYWRCNTKVALKMKCHLPDMTDLVLKFEHQFSKDIVCFGFEEFLLVSVILNPAHGFICNDSIELEAVIEIVNEILEDEKVVNNNTDGEAFVDEKLCYLVNHENLKEQAIGGEIINDWNEDQVSSREENSLFPIKAAEFIDEYKAIIKEEVVDDDYYDEAPLNCNNDEMEQSNNVEDEEDEEVQPNEENQVETINGEVNVIIKKDESKYEKQLVAKVDYKEEDKLEALKDEYRSEAEDLKDEKYSEAEEDCVDKKEQLVSSQEVMNICEIKVNPVFLADDKDLQSPAVENLFLENKLDQTTDFKLEDMKDEYRSEAEDLKDEKYSEAEEDCVDKKEQLVSSQEVMNICELKVNPVFLADDKDLQSPAVENLFLENKLDQTTDFKLEDMKDPDEKQDQMNLNCSKDGEVYVTIEKKETIAKEVVIVSMVEDNPSHLDNKDFLSPAVELHSGNKLDSKSAEHCEKNVSGPKDNEGVSGIQLSNEARENNPKGVKIPKIIIDNYEN